MRRILVIRGGAIGDFVLTLPAIGLLRTAFPSARLEILGYRHIIALAEGRFYADAVRSIEYSAFAPFFGRGTDLPAELADYFSRFDLIVSYLFDPDGHFATNLRRCGVEEIIHAPHQVVAGGGHASLQLARPLSELGLAAPEAAATLHPSAADRDFAEDFLRGLTRPIIALHPGSGSPRKNWPLERWSALAAQLLPQTSLLFVGGEADRAELAELRARFRSANVRFAENLPLPQLAAVLAACDQFVGHDSGISHIAAAAGTPALLFFGPTDPNIWAPVNARVLRAPDGNLAKLSEEQVAHELMRIGIST